MKLDRRMLAAKTKSTERYVVLNGFVYRSSARKLEKTQGAGAMPANRTKKTVVIRSKFWKEKVTVCIIEVISLEHQFSDD